VTPSTPSVPRPDHEPREYRARRGRVGDLVDIADRLAEGAILEDEPEREAPNPRRVDVKRQRREDGR